MYAGDIGVDVVNMSFFIDPWLYNCPANPADSPAQQAEQRTIVEATQRAIDFAHARGVTLVAAAGNEHSDIDRCGQPDRRHTSPDYPLDTAYPHDRHHLPDDADRGDHVIAVSAVGPTAEGLLLELRPGADDVAAPGGGFHDTSAHRSSARPRTRCWPHSRTTSPIRRSTSTRTGRRTARSSSAVPATCAY